MPFPSKDCPDAEIDYIDAFMWNDINYMANEFMEEYLELEYVGFDEIYKRGKGLGDKGKVFLRIHLEDGTSFRISYWTEENLISPGVVGTDRLKKITIGQGSSN